MHKIVFLDRATIAVEHERTLPEDVVRRLDLLEQPALLEQGGLRFGRL
jgi:hypothetical protein